MQMRFIVKYEDRKTEEKFEQEFDTREEAEEVAQLLFDDGFAVVPKIFEERV